MEQLAGWRKSSHSGSNGGGCIEAAGHDSQIHIRDTQDQSGPVLRFNPAAWRRFTTQLKDPLA
jgi:hypothetical protein